MTSIHALEPMTHLQTANKYPDMVALEMIQQFAMLNQISLSDGSTPPVRRRSLTGFRNTDKLKVTSFLLTDPVAPQLATNYFFQGGEFGAGLARLGQ